MTCRQGVAVFNMSYFGKFYLSGPDAKQAADWLFTADVNKKPGQSGTESETPPEVLRIQKTNARAEGNLDINRERAGSTCT
jgi:hypothetical protein